MTATVATQGTNTQGANTVAPGIRRAARRGVNLAGRTAGIVTTGGSDHRVMVSRGREPKAYLRVSLPGGGSSPCGGSSAWFVTPFLLTECLPCPSVSPSVG